MLGSSLLGRWAGEGPLHLWVQGQAWPSAGLAGAGAAGGLVAESDLWGPRSQVLAYELRPAAWPLRPLLSNGDKNARSVGWAPRLHVTEPGARGPARTRQLSEGPGRTREEHVGDRPGDAAQGFPRKGPGVAVRPEDICHRRQLPLPFGWGQARRARQGGAVVGTQLWGQLSRAGGEGQAGGACGAPAGLTGA